MYNVCMYVCMYVCIMNVCMYVHTYDTLQFLFTFCKTVQLRNCTVHAADWSCDSVYYRDQSVRNSHSLGGGGGGGGGGGIITG